MDDYLNSFDESLLDEESSKLDQVAKFYRSNESQYSQCMTLDTSTESRRLFSYLEEPKIFREPDQYRISYYDKLRSTFKTIGYPKKRDYNSIVLFDWDDTLFCSSYLTKKKILLNRKGMEDLGPKFMEKIKKVELNVMKILKMSIEYGDTYIITNATKYWVEFSCSLIYPNVLGYLSKVTIISARDNYEKLYPNQPKKWKLQTFIDLAQKYDKNTVTNIICIGDSEGEAEAGMELGSLFREAYLKIIKFREDPKPEHIAKQLCLVETQFNSLHSAVRNISIHVEKNSKR